jgi:hypothetical protein
MNEMPLGAKDRVPILLFYIRINQKTEILIAVIMTTIFGDVSPCSLGVGRHLHGKFYFQSVQNPMAHLSDLI